MTTFTWLCVGHLIGDWLLQSEWMAVGKRKRLVTLPGLAHFAAYTLAIVGALAVAGVCPADPVCFLVLAATIFVSHGLVDSTSFVERWMRLVRKGDLEIPRLMVDQTFHILVLVVVASVVA